MHDSLFIIYSIDIYEITALDCGIGLRLQKLYIYIRIIELNYYRILVSVSLIYSIFFRRLLWNYMFYRNLLLRSAFLRFRM